MGFSQQPWGLGFIAWFSLVPVIFFLNEETKIKRIILYSFLWGFIYHITFLNWLAGNVGIEIIFLRYATMLLVVLFLSLNISLIFLLFYYFKKITKSEKSIYFLPFIFVGVEYIRSLGLYGFTWNSLSYTQVDYLLISQIIEYTGIYGLTFWIVIVNLTIYNVLNRNNKNNVLIALLCFLMPWLIGYVIKSNIIESSDKLKIKIVQPNIPLQEKRKGLNHSLERLLSLSSLSPNDSISLIIWPESSIPSRLNRNSIYNSKLSTKMNNFLKSSNFSLVAGLETSSGKNRYNSSILFKKDSIINIYNKQRLVPNVEYTPKFFNDIGLNMGQIGFNIGEDLTMFNVNKINFASMVCIESIFSSPTRDFVNNGANFLVYIVNDGWYIKAPEPQQHAKRSIYRAIENRRFVVRAANTGISMVIDLYGNITQRLDLNKQGVIETHISSNDTKTFYTKYGDVFSIFNIFVLILALLSFNFKRIFERKNEV